MKPPFCSIIIVTHNSQKFLPKAMEALLQQTRPADQILLVDTGSQDATYLKPYASLPSVRVHMAEKESGFCRGNNVGYQLLSPECDYVFLVNPDLFLTPHYLEKAIAWMEQPAHRPCAAITGTTLGFDIEKDEPTGYYDTTGIFSTWYGRWYDRAQRESIDLNRYQSEEEISAICGAVFFCRRHALDQVLLKNGDLLDSSFYMYKEDIDLSLRLKSQNWKLYFVPSLLAYHCRGWSLNRRHMPRKLRLCSALNELRIHFRMRALPKIVYSSIKWTAVKLLDV